MSSIIRSTVLIAVFSILSKVLGLIKWGALSNRFGAGREIDIYFAAFRAPDFIFNLLIAGTLSVAFIPVFVKYFNQDKKQAFVIASTVFNLTLIVVGCLSVLGIIFAPILVGLIAPGFDDAAKTETINLTRILMISPLLFSLSSILTSILHSFKRFVMAAIGPLFYNLAIIVGIIFFYPAHGFTGIVWSAIVGALVHFLLQLPVALRLGFMPFKYFSLRHKGIREIGKLFLPRIFGLDLGQASLLIGSIIGSLLPAGSIAIMTYAYDLETVPLGIFAIAFAITSFPVLSEFASKGDTDGFKTFLSKTMIQLLFLIIPISVFTLILRAQIVRLVYGALESTKFSFEDTALTAQALGFFALSLFAQAVLPLLARAFYALHNTWIPVLGGALAIIINAALAYSLSGMLGAPGMALAFTIAVIVDAVLLFALLRQRLGGDLADDFLFLRLVKISVASVVMGTFSYLSLYAIAPLVNMQTYAGILIQTVGALVVAGLVYLFAGFVINLPEAREFAGVLKSWFGKFTRIIGS